MHERLALLGLVATSDALDVYGDGTAAVVESFQHSRGLPLTGHVDDTTWNRLIEAGWRLGHRLLFVTRPTMRGDDVAELQVRLAQLGFNPGRIDGIFGNKTGDALTEFQHNRAIAADGTLTRTTLTEMLRMTSVNNVRSLVTDARDLAGFYEVSAGPLVLCGHSPLLALIDRALSDVTTVVVLPDESPEVIATFANTNQASFVLSLQTLKHIDGVLLHYWASYRSHSRRGEQLASHIASAFTRSQHLPRVEVTGMALPILRETKMITLHIEHGEESAETYEKLAAIISDVTGEVIHRQT